MNQAIRWAKWWRLICHKPAREFCPHDSLG
jgi:hypothetical protein